MGDKADFHLDKFVNKQNCRYRAAENSGELNQRCEKLQCGVEFSNYVSLDLICLSGAKYHFNNFGMLC